MKRFMTLLILAFLVCSPAAASAAEEAIDAFTVGMSKKDAMAAGAKETDDPDTLLSSLTWKDVEWKTVLMLKKDAVVTVLLQTDVNNRTVFDILGFLEERTYAPLTARGADKKDVDLYKMQAEGKSKDELEAAFNTALETFADDANGGVFLSVFCPAGTLKDMAAVIQKKGDEDAFMKEVGDTVIYVLQMSHKDNRLLFLATTFATMNE